MWQMNFPFPARKELRMKLKPLIASVATALTFSYAAATLWSLNAQLKQIEADNERQEKCISWLHTRLTPGERIPLDQMTVERIRKK